MRRSYVSERGRGHARAFPGAAGWKRFVVPAGILILLLLLAAAWRWTPLNEWLDLDTLLEFSDYLQEGPYTPFAVAAAYLAAAVVMFPVTLLNLVVIMVFGALLGPVYALAGAALSAAAMYCVGNWIGRVRVRRFAGARLNRISKRLARRGVTAMAVVRLVPIAPFTVVNLVAGASHIRLRDYLLGTVLGMAPGITATTLVVNRATAVLREPGVLTIALLVVLAVVLVGGGYFLRRHFAD